jgi:MFS transporter, PPP family, 3-phenylpropionic acid transporter
MCTRVPANRPWMQAARRRLASVAASTAASDGPRLALSAAYVANFGALAASGPFLAVHLGAVGFSPSAAAQVLALLLLVRVVAIPAWTLLADRAGTIGGVLLLVSAGALLAFAALFLDPSPALVAACLLVFAAFRAPFGALLDAHALGDMRGAGRTFGAVRAWGTAGYAVCAMLTGALVARDGSRAVIYVTTALLGVALASALAIRGKNAPLARSDERTWALFASVLRRPRVLLLFAVALFQEMGLAPYDALFPSYLTRLAGATAAGVAIAIGAGAEFFFLLGGAAIVRRLGPERLLVTACAVSMARWASIALVTSASALIAIQVLHALSFGGFYMASVILMDRETPPSLRASGQGLFASFSFGVAAAIGLSIAGLVERRGGMPAVFGFAAASSLVGTLGASLLRVGGDEVGLARSP